MVTIKLMGGLGNQMFQYAFGFALAKRKNTKLSFDVSFFENCGKSTSRSYELDQLCISCKNHSKKPFFAKIPKIGWRIAPFFNYFIGYFFSEKYFADYKEDIYREFQFKEKIQGPQEGNSV